MSLKRVPRISTKPCKVCGKWFTYAGQWSAGKCAVCKKKKYIAKPNITRLAKATAKLKLCLELTEKEKLLLDKLSPDTFVGRLYTLYLRSEDKVKQGHKAPV